MALSMVTVTWDEQDTGAGALGGYISFQLTADLQDTADGIDVRRSPAETVFFAGPSGSSPPLTANDSAGVTPAGTAYVITVAIAGQQPVTFTSQILIAHGATQTLAFLQANAAVPVTQYSQYLPLPSGTAQAGQVPVATGAGEASAWGSAGGGGAASASRLYAAGHSWVRGNNNNEAGERWTMRLAAVAGSEEINYGIDGAVLAWDCNGGTAPGGYPNVINTVRPRAAAASTYTDRTAAPYLAWSPLAVLQFGFWDLAWLSSSVANNIAWFKMALRAMTCVARAGGIFGAFDGSINPVGDWTPHTSQSLYGSPVNAATGTVGSSVTITVPADFPGGEVDIITLVSGTGGGKWSTVVDGGTAQVLDGTGAAFGPSAGRFNAVVQRLTGLAAGTHTIVMTLAALDAGATVYFDSWLIAAPHPGVVVYTTQPHMPVLPLAVASAPHTPVTAADVDQLNLAYPALAAEFTDGNVLVADVAAAFTAAGGTGAYTTPNSLYSNDNEHPSASGHGVVAETVQAAVTAHPPAAAGAFTSEGLALRIIGTPGAFEPGLANNWVLASGYFCKDRANSTIVSLAGLTNGASPAPGTKIFTLWSGYGPRRDAYFPAVAWTGSTPGTGWVQVTAAGDVNWVSGNLATEFDLFISFPADSEGT